MAARKTVWKLFSDEMPPGCAFIFAGGRHFGKWRFFVMVLAPDATAESIVREGVFTHWAPIPAAYAGGPPQFVPRTKSK